MCLSSREMDREMDSHVQALVYICIYIYMCVLLEQLHWLPIRSRITFKVCLHTFKALNGLAPLYMAELIIPYRLSRNLCSAHTSLLHRKFPNLKNTGGRYVSVCALKFWSMPPLSLRRCTTLDTFKPGLKTHLFKEAVVNT